MREVTYFVAGSIAKARKQGFEFGGYGGGRVVLEDDLIERWNGSDLGDTLAGELIRSIVSSTFVLLLINRFAIVSTYPLSDLFLLDRGQAYGMEDKELGDTSRACELSMGSVI
jgi:hypothetical protein